MKKQHLFIAILLAILFALTNCQDHKSNTTVTENNDNPDNVNKEIAKKELLKKDIEFSDYCVSEGIAASFINYIADEGVLLRQNHMPIVGKDSITALMKRGKNKNVKMSWIPLFADVAVSGEIGYTYGTYKVQFEEESGSTSTSEGTYVSIWKKDKKGNWKLALDSGNEGLSPLKQ